jgi:hypothetical protein
MMQNLVHGVIAFPPLEGTSLLEDIMLDGIEVVEPGFLNVDAHGAGFI